MEKKGILKKILISLAAIIMLLSFLPGMQSAVYALPINVTFSDAEDVYTDSGKDAAHSYSLVNRSDPAYKDQSGTYFVNFVGGNTSVPVIYERSALKFNLTGISGTISSAQLKIHVVDANNSPVVNLISTSDNSWSQNAVDPTKDPALQEASFPDFSSADIINGYSNVSVSANTDMTFDVKTYIQSVVDAGALSVSFVLTGNEGGNQEFDFVNILATQTAYRPELILSYTPSASPPTVTGAAFTNNTMPTWSWTAGGGGNGTFRYKLDNSDLTSGATTTTSLSYTPGTALADGSHTLYVQESNGAASERWSNSGSFTIIVDTTPPVAPVVTGTSPTNNVTPTWTWSSGGGNGNYRFKLGDNDFSSGATLTAATSFTPGSALSDGTYTLYVQEQDNAGNWSSSGSFSIIVDTTHSVTVSANSSGGGTVSGGGTYSEGASVTVLAVPNSGYNFVNWTEGGIVVSTNTTYAFIQGAANRALVANFIPKTYTIATIADVNMTALTHGYSPGTQETKSITVTRTGTEDLNNLAAALSGMDAGGFEISPPAVTTLNTGTSSTTFTIKAKDGLAPGTYTATVTVSVDSMTNVTFTVTQEVEAVSASISPDTGSFDKNPAYQADVSTTITWNDAAAVIDVKKAGVTIGAAAYSLSGNTLTIAKSYLAAQVEGSLALTVHFDKGNTATLTINISNTPVPTYTVTFNSQGGSSVPSLSSISSGSTISEPAAPTQLGYTFKGWYKESACTNAWNFSVDQVTSGRTLYAKWVANHTVSASANPTIGGSVSGGGTFDEGASVTLTAAPNSSYTFVNWTEGEGGSVTSTNAAYNFTLGTQDRTLVANFIPKTYTVAPLADVTLAALNQGYVSGTQETKSVTVTRTGTGELDNLAAALSGTNASSLEISLPAVTTLNAGNPSTTFTVKAKDGLVAGTYTAAVTVSADNMTNVTFTVTQEVVTVVSASISPDSGTFDRNPAYQADMNTIITWNDAAAVTDVKKAGVSIGAAGYLLSGNTLTINKSYLAAQSTGPLALSVEFNKGNPETLTISIIDTAIPTYTVTFDAQGGGLVSSISDVTSGSAINLPAEPTRLGYTFNGWYKESTCTNAWNFSTDYVTSDITLYAKWIANHNVSVLVSPSIGGAVSGGGIYCEGASVTLTASPNSGYTFVNWTEGGSIVSTNATYVFTVGTADRTLTANFTVVNQGPSGGGESGGGIGGGGSGNGNGGGTPTTVSGSVIDGASGTTISNLTVTVTADSSGKETVSMAAEQTLVVRQPDGSVSPVGNFSQVEITGTAGTTVSVSPDGTIKVPDLAKGTDNSFKITYDLGNGQKITIGNMEIKIDNNGAVSLTTSLIDPYGIISDAVTGKAIGGVKVTLYYADTARNKASGKTPDTLVSLPGIEGFKPNNNQNPQTSDVSGAYGFMVFPTSDYYIVALKDGYNQYISPTISVEQEIVKWDFKMEPTNPGLYRLEGSTRVDTALVIAKAEYSGQVDNVVLTTADNYPDALAGSVLAYKLKAPILLVGSSDADQKKVLDYLKASLNPAGTVYILGGVAAVSSTMESQVTANGFSHVNRIAGIDRFETSVQIANQLGVKTGTPIVLVSGENYPDALSISSMAAQMQIPILLVQKNGLNDSIEQTITAIKPSKVYMIGGEGVISSAVENRIAEITALAQADIVRIGAADRYATSLAVAQYFNSTVQNICAATGTNFPDALAGSIYAAYRKAPIILVDDNLSEQTISYLRAGKLNGAVIFGGKGAVSQDVEHQLIQLISDR